MRSLSTTTRTSVRTLPEGSITLPAWMALVAAHSGPAARIIKTAALRTCVIILCSGLFDSFRYLACERLRRDHASKRTEAENPALQSLIEADIEGHQQPA